MKPTIRHLAWALLFAAGTGQAAVTGASAQPSTARAAATGSTSIAVSWNVQTNTGGNVSSSQGVFRTQGGVVLGTIDRPLTKTTATAGTVKLNESVLVPADMAARVLKLGQNALRYERNFTDGTGASLGQLTIQLATAPAAGFGVSQIALSFDDGKPLALVARDDKLTAHAKIATTGSGIVKAVWEIAGPNPDGSNPAYMIVATVHQAANGAEAVTVNGPALPTNTTGTYLVRLRVSEPATAVEIPVIHYYVGEKQN